MAEDAGRLDELLALLADANERLREWQAELNAHMRKQMADGVAGKDAVSAMIDRQKQQLAEGDTPVDRARLDEELVELAEIYVRLPDSERARVRAELREMRQVRSQIYGTMHSMARRLRDTRDPSWLDAGLAMAAIEGGYTDFRDLYVALGELWLAAEAVRIRPRKRFTKAAEMAGEERDSLNRSGRTLMQAFPHSAHLHSIRRKR